MSDVNLALVLVGVLSLLLSATEVPRLAKSSIRAAVSVRFFMYVAFFVIGNVASTLLALKIVAPETAQASLPGPRWFWIAFVGVFGFHVIIKNLNVTLFDRGVLSIEEWIATARDNAIGDAILQQEIIANRSAQQVAKQLTQLPPHELNSYLMHHLGSGVVAQLNQAATSNGADPSFIKALALAYQKPAVARAALGKQGRPSTKVLLIVGVVVLGIAATAIVYLRPH